MSWTIAEKGCPATGQLVEASYGYWSPGRRRLRSIALRFCLSLPLVVLGLGRLLGEELKDATPTPVPQKDWIEGTVTAIVDGDTVHVSGKDAEYLVDLAGIDAPEKGQPSGEMATQVLYLKVMKREVRVLVLPPSSSSPVVLPVAPAPTTSSKRSAFPCPSRRHVFGIVYCEGCVNSALVQEGLAWHDSEQCPSRSLAEAEEQARKGCRGLWQRREEPTSPWEWRRERSKETLVSGAPDSEQTPAPDLSRLFEAETPTAAVEAATQVQPVALPRNPRAAGKTEPSPGGSHWLTTSSGIRHNSRCRYFQTSKGRPCGADEGRPCKKCGG